MAAYRNPARWITRGRYPSPDWIQIEDTGGTRIILAAVPAARPLRHDR